MEPQPNLIYATAFEPLGIIPALIGLIAGLAVWRRHRADRRGRVFVALMISEIALLLPFALVLAGIDFGRLDESLLLSAVMITAGVSSALFLHFGLSFPHRRPWLTARRMRRVYAAAILLGAMPAFASLLPSGYLELATQAPVILIAPLMLIALTAGCVAVYRSYREMTAEERRIYRAPVLGVLAGMVLGLVIDIALGTVAASGNRHVETAGNVVSTAANLLFPLFFYMAAVKYRLLEHHSQDYVAKI